jgi:hypothetical protein
MHERITTWAGPTIVDEAMQAGEKKMVGWDGIKPPTPGFSDPPAPPGSDE